jgi:RimJ/RimL family protein N-acetyltransferase
MTVVDFDRTHVAAFLRFVGELPEGDLTFIKEPITNPETVSVWADADSSGRRWVVLEGEVVVGFLAVLRLQDWSDHVAEIRLVVHPDHRGRGLGRDLARKALLHAAEKQLSKLIVEIVADDAAHIAMFSAMGFTGEALLRDHIRDREGQPRDLVMLAHYLDATWADMEALGLTSELVPDLD